MPNPLRTTHGSRPPDTGRHARALIGVIALIVLFITPVSATILYDETLEVYDFTGGQSTFSSAGSGYSGDPKALNFLVFKQIQDCNDISYIVIEASGDWSSLSPGNHAMEYTLDSHTSTGTINVFKAKNALGQITNTRITLYFDNWDIGELTGEKTVYFTPSLGSIRTLYSAYDNPQTETGNSPVRAYNRFYQFPYTITASCGKHFYNTITIEKFDDGNSIRLIVNREYGTRAYASNVTVYDVNGHSVYNDQSTANLNQVFLASSVDGVILQSAGNTWNYPLRTSTTPTENQVTIYIRNSQTGNLLAGSHIIISASVGGEFHEVVNQTLPGGTATYTLQPTGGGLPNPDYYRLIATADGYNPYMPYIDFELDRPTNLIVMMEPTGGGPEDENKTFIEFYVRDLNTNPISGATVTCGGYSLLTNSAGFTQFELPKNAAYAYTVRKTGYMTVQGTATVADDPRYTVNVVLGQGEIPTLTPTPTEPGATPTPDRRTNEQKGQAVIDMIADNAEGIGALALICLIMGLLKLMAKW